MTALRSELGTAAARKVLESRGAILASRLGHTIPSHFSSRAIDLGPRKTGSLLELYERGHVFGVEYSRERMPMEQALVADLDTMLALYRHATALGGWSELSDELEDEQEGETPPDGKDEHLEERRRRVLHGTLERNRTLSRRAKELHGYICKACGFDFEHAYGALGRHFIEAHHLTALSALPMTGAVKLSPRNDFTVVCANCHRMIHRKDAPETFEEFVTLVRDLRE